MNSTPGHGGVLVDADFRALKAKGDHHPEGISGEAGAEATAAAADFEATQVWQTTARNDTEVLRARALVYAVYTSLARHSSRL